MLRITLLFTLALIYTQSYAQLFPDGIVDINQHHFSIDAAGLMGFRPHNGLDRFRHEVPAGDSTRAIVAAAPWFGGLVNGDTICVADRFRYDYTGWMAGPVMTDQDTYNEEAIHWDRVWKVSREEIEYHANNYSSSGYQPIEAIENWPGNGDPQKGQSAQLAPYFDTDGDGLYEPMDGDYPMIKGDQAVYVIFNGARTNPIGTFPMLSPVPVPVEIHAMLYGFSCSEDEVLDHALFLDYRIINRSENVIDNSFFGFWSDFDLGNSYDDYLASDVGRSMFFVRNGDAYDEDRQSSKGFEDDLGILGVKFLRGAPLPTDDVDNQVGVGAFQSINGKGFGDGIIDNEYLGMERFIYHISSNGPQGYPQNVEDYYSLLSGTWRDGTPLSFGGYGYDPGDGLPAKYMYPGASDPLHYGTYGVNPVDSGFTQDWTEFTVGSTPGNRRGVGSTGPFTLTAGQEVKIELALVFARAPWGQDSLALVNAADHIQSLYDDQVFECGSLYPLSVQQKSDQAELSIFPNPSQGIVNIVGDDLIAWKLFDHQGRIIKNGKTERVDFSEQADGLYLLTIESSTDQSSFKIIKTQ